MGSNNSKDEELLDAVSRGNFKRFQVLLSQGANIKVTDNEGNTLLHLSQNGEITKDLLRRGSSVHRVNYRNETALHFVVKGGGGKTVVEELLKYGAHVSCTDRHNNTPLHIAVNARNPSKEVFMYLVKYGSDISTSNWFVHCGSTTLLTRQLRQLQVKYRLIRNISEYQKEVNSIAENRSYIIDSGFVAGCAAEILQMKTHILQDDISLFDVVENSFSFKSLFSKPLYSLFTSLFWPLPSTLYSVPRRYVHCGNELSMRLKYMDFSTQYPIYNEVILDGIKPYVARANLLDKLKMVDFYTELGPIDQVDLTTNKVGRTVQEALMCLKNLKSCFKANLKANEIVVKANHQAVVKRVSLNYPCVYGISEYLSNEDLLNFIATNISNNPTSTLAKPAATNNKRKLEEFDDVHIPAKCSRLE